MNLILNNRQRSVSIDTRWLRKFAAVALDTCAKVSADERFALNDLEEIGVTFVSDSKIAALHVEFMAIEGATDVITFEHGEIVISAETARKCALEFGHSTEQELALYTVHGMLHLNGFDDRTPKDAARMRKVQDRIWKECLAKMETPNDRQTA